MTALTETQLLKMYVDYVELRLPLVNYEIGNVDKVLAYDEFLESFIADTLDKAEDDLEAWSK